MTKMEESFCLKQRQIIPLQLVFTKLTMGYIKIKRQFECACELKQTYNTKGKKSFFQNTSALKTVNSVFSVINKQFNVLKMEARDYSIL